MADSKISALNPVVTPLGTDVLADVQLADVNVETKKITLDQIKSYSTSGHDLQSSYNEGPDITLSAGVGPIRIMDALAPIGGNLFSITDNAGTTPYLNINDNSIFTSNSLVFTGAQPRIGGDLTNPTESDRIMFQTESPNASSTMGVIPNGSSTVSGFAAYSHSTPVNCAKFTIQSDGVTAAVINSEKIGSGTANPIQFQIDGVVKWTIDTTGTMFSDDATDLKTKRVGLYSSNPSFSTFITDVSTATADRQISIDSFDADRTLNLKNTTPVSLYGNDVWGPENTVYVSNTGAPFTSIQLAIDSVKGGASALNRYLVKVGPGIYDERILMAPFVDVQGVGESTVISPSIPSPNDYIVRTDNDCSISNVSLNTASTANGIRVIEVGAQSGNELYDSCFVRDITIRMASTSVAALDHAVYFTNGPLHSVTLDNVNIYYEAPTASTVTALISSAGGMTDSIISNINIDINSPVGTIYSYSNVTVRDSSSKSSSVQPIELTSNLSNVYDYDNNVNYIDASIRAGDSVSFKYESFAGSGSTGSQVIVGVTSTPATFSLDSAAAVSGSVYIIKDESGSASLNNITVNTSGGGLIDGQASIPITADYGVLRAYHNGTDWFTF